MEPLRRHWKIGVSPRFVVLMLADGRGLVVLSQVVSLILLTASLKFAASGLRSGEFGRFALILAVAGALGLFLFGPLAGWGTRHYREASETQAIGAYYGGLATGLAVAILMAWPISLLLASWTPVDLTSVGGSSSLLQFGMLLGFAVGLNDVAIAVSTASQRTKTAACFLFLSSLARVVSVGLLFAMNVPSAEWLTILTASALLIVGVVHVLAILAVDSDLIRKSRGTWHRSIGGLGRYTMPFVVWAIPAYILAFGDRLILAQTFSASVVGTYAAMMVATTSVANAISSTVNRASSPLIFAYAGEATDALRIRSARKVNSKIVVGLAALMVPLVVVYFLFPVNVILLFSSGDYLDHAEWLAPLMFSAMLFVLSQQLTVHALIVKRPWVYLPARFVHAGLVLGLMLSLVPGRGIAAAAASLVVGNFAQLVMAALTNRILDTWERNSARAAYRSGMRPIVP